MAVEITMPQLSDTMHEGKILSWLKKEGDKVSRGDALAEVATDKADLEIESFHEGTLLKVLVREGDTVKVGSVIAVVGEAGEKPTTPQIKTPKKEATIAQPPKQEVVVAKENVTKDKAVEKSRPEVVVDKVNKVEITSDTTVERVKISPLARNLAKNHGVDVTELRGTGEGGRILRRDVEAALGSATIVGNGNKQSLPPVAGKVPSEVQAKKPVISTVSSTPATSPGSKEPLTKMRQAIAERMVESSNSIPHFYVTAKICVDALSKMKQSLKPLPQYEGLTYTHLIVKAAALALRSYPRINANYSDGSMLVQPQDVNIGIITAVSDGLLIPVIKNADTLALSDIVSDGRALVQRARSGRPKAGDLLGGTFSISNMGMFAVESFTAIINPGQGAIMAVSAISDEPIVSDGAVKIGKVMRVTLSVDHRIIDGVMAGEFLTELKRLIEDPVLLLA